MTYNKLLVVTSASWLAKDLAAAGTIPVEGTLGLDAPALDETTALWCSGAWAIRLLKTGFRHPFLSAGPNWLPTVPKEFLRREVWSGRLKDMPYKGTGRTFYKLSEHKHGAVPAGVRNGRGSFLSDVTEAFRLRTCAPDILDLQCTASEPVDFIREYRCFVAHGRVTAASFYKATLPGVHGSDVEITWDAYDSPLDPRLPETGEAASFAQRVVDSMGDNQPPGYTLDVGTDHDGRLSVIEANAAWSSNIYHADPAGAIESVLASQELDNGRWAWKPDRLFLEHSRALPAG